MIDEISDLEVVQAFAEYELEHRPGVLGSEELPAETLMRKPGRRQDGEADGPQIPVDDDGGLGQAMDVPAGERALTHAA